MYYYGTIRTINLTGSSVQSGGVRLSDYPNPSKDVGRSNYLDWKPSESQS